MPRELRVRDPLDATAEGCERRREKARVHGAWLRGVTRADAFTRSLIRVFRVWRTMIIDS